MKDNNTKIIELYESTPDITMTQIGKQIGVTKQRVSFVLRRYRIRRVCANCYHYQEFKHCSCRVEADVIKTPNKCSDWEPINK